MAMEKLTIQVLILQFYNNNNRVYCCDNGEERLYEIGEIVYGVLYV